MFESVFKYLKHRPLLRRWILVGLAIILVTGLGMIASAFFLVHKLYTKEETLQDRIVEENVAALDSACEEIVLAAQTFITNNMVQAASKHGDETVEDRMRLAEVSKLMGEYMAVHKPIGKFFVFFPKMDNGVLSGTEYIEKSDGIHIISGLDLEAEHNQKLLSDKLYSTFKITGSANDPQLYYSMATLYATPFEEQDIVLLININKSVICSRLSDDYTFFLATEDGSYIQLDDEKLDDAFVSECISTEDSRIIGKRVIHSYELNNYGLRLIAVMDSGVVSGAIRPFIIGVLLYGLAIFLIVSSSATYLLRKQYRPIEELISFMEKHEGTSSGEFSVNEDEFKKIEAGMDRAFKHLQQSEDDYFEFINDNATRLIRILYTGTDLADTKVSESDDRRFLVVSYDIDDPSGMPINQKDRDLVWFIIHNVSEELIGPEHLLISGGLGHWFYNIVMLTGHEDISLPELTQKLNTVCSFIRDKFNMALVANISDIHHGMHEIPAAHRESMLVREYRIYVGHLENVAFYKELSLDDDAKETLTSWDQMEQIQNMYRMHRGIEAQNMLDDIVTAAAKSVKEEEVADNSAQENFGKSAVLVEKAKNYVDESYSDKNMNVNSIAAELNVNNSYLSRTFKQVYGVGMLEYINKVRLENAEKLMELGVTVKDAADQVGFTTPRPLIRCFREKHGTTPGDYYKTK